MERNWTNKKWTNLERETYAALARLGTASVNEIVDAHLTTTRSNCNIRYALGRLTAAGFVSQIEGFRRDGARVWELRPGAILPEQLLAPKAEKIPAPAPLPMHSTMPGSMPEALAVHFTLAGMVADQMQHPLHMRAPR